MPLIRRARDDERGAALVTALAATMIMLALGMAILSIVDTQASVSATERTRDRGFNLAESVLNSQAFVLGRNWPASAPPSPEPARCGDIGAGFDDTLGSIAPEIPAVERLRKTLNASYTDTAYSGATWQINLCDDIAGSTVWSDAVLNNRTWDLNGNKRLWVVAQSNVGDENEKRSLVGLVLVRENSVIPSKYGLVAGGLSDDLGGTLNAVTGNALNGVLDGLLGTTPSVAKDPLFPPASGVTGVRCGATDVQLFPISTCLAGTVGGLATIPLVSKLLTGGTLEKFPTITTATPTNIDQLRKQAIVGLTYKDVSLGGPVNTNQVCQVAGSPTDRSIVFIERVGINGDQYCVLDVSAGVKWKALIIGSGGVILRGSNTATGTPVSPIPPTADPPQTNTFSGVVYALNRQRLPVADGGQGLGDDASPGREIVRIEKGAHVKGGVYADGRSAKVGVHPPLVLNTTELITSLIPCEPALNTCLVRNTVLALGGVLQINALLDAVGLTKVVNGILNQLNPQRTSYGSAIVSDVNAIKSLTAYGASGVIPGSFRDLQGR
ncbi:MAG: hypothetical protein WKF96_15880 [Solirubrobacteraceae bacterium]